MLEVNVLRFLWFCFLQAQSRLDRVLAYYRRQEASASVSSHSRASGTSEAPPAGQAASSRLDVELLRTRSGGIERTPRRRATVAAGDDSVHSCTDHLGRLDVHDTHPDSASGCCLEEEAYIHRNACHSLDGSPRCSERHTAASADECASVPVQSSVECFSGASSAVFGVSSSSRGSFSSTEERSERRTRPCNSSVESEEDSIEGGHRKRHQPRRAVSHDGRGRGGEGEGETTRCGVTGMSSCCPSPCPSPCEGSTRAGPSQSSSVVSPSFKGLSPESLSSMENEISSWLRGSDGVVQSEEEVEKRLCSRSSVAECSSGETSGNGRGNRSREMAAVWGKGDQEIGEVAVPDEDEGLCRFSIDQLEGRVATEEEESDDDEIVQEEEHPLRVRRSIASVITTEFVEPSSDEEEAEGQGKVRTTSSAAEEKWWRIRRGDSLEGSDPRKHEQEGGQLSSNDEEEGHGEDADTEEIVEKEFPCEGGGAGASTTVGSTLASSEGGCQARRSPGNWRRHGGSCPPLSRRSPAQGSRLRRHSVHPIYLPAAWRRRAFSLIHQSRENGGGVTTNSVSSPSSSPDLPGNSFSSSTPVFSSMKEGFAHVLSLQLRESQLKWELLYRDQLAFVSFHQASQRRRQRGLELLHAHQTACAFFASSRSVPSHPPHSSSQETPSYSLHPSVPSAHTSDSIPSSSPSRASALGAPGRAFEVPLQYRRPPALHPALATSSPVFQTPNYPPSTPRGGAAVTEDFLPTSLPSPLAHRGPCFSDASGSHRLSQGSTAVPRSPVVPRLQDCSGDLGRFCPAPVESRSPSPVVFEGERGIEGSGVASCQANHNRPGYGTVSDSSGLPSAAHTDVLAAGPTQFLRPSPVSCSYELPRALSEASQSLHPAAVLDLPDSSTVRMAPSRAAASADRAPVVYTQAASNQQPSGCSSARHADGSPALFLALSPLPTPTPGSPINCQSLQPNGEREERRDGDEGDEGSPSAFSRPQLVSRAAGEPAPPPSYQLQPRDLPTPVWVREEEDSEDALAFAQAATIAARGGRGERPRDDPAATRHSLGTMDAGSSMPHWTRERGEGGDDLVGEEGDRGTPGVPVYPPASSWPAERSSDIESTTPDTLPVIDLGGMMPPRPSIRLPSPSSASRAGLHTSGSSRGVVSSPSSLSLSSCSPHLVANRPTSRRPLALDPTPLTCVSAASGFCRETSSAFDINQFDSPENLSPAPPISSGVSSASSHRPFLVSRTQRPSDVSLPSLANDVRTAPPLVCSLPSSSSPQPGFSGRHSDRHSRNQQLSSSSRGPDSSAPPPCQSTYFLSSSSSTFPGSSLPPCTSAVSESPLPRTGSSTHREQQETRPGERDFSRCLHPSQASSTQNLHDGQQRRAPLSECASHDCRAAQASLQHRDLFERQLRKNEAHLEGLRVLMNRLLVVMEQIRGGDSTRT